MQIFCVRGNWDFIGEFLRIYEVCFPLKVIKQMKKVVLSMAEPWSLKSFNKKNRLYKRLQTDNAKLKELVWSKEESSL